MVGFRHAEADELLIAIRRVENHGALESAQPLPGNVQPDIPLC